MGDDSVEVWATAYESEVAISTTTAINTKIVCLQKGLHVFNIEAVKIRFIN